MKKNEASRAARELMGFHASGDAFSLVEVVVATLLLAVVFGMILGAVVMVNKAVMNEHPIAFSSYHGAVPAGDLRWYTTTPAGTISWGYWEAKSVANFQGYDFPVAPSRAADAQADALWKQLHELYEQSTSVAVVHQYLIHDFTTAAPHPMLFCGGNYANSMGYLGLSYRSDGTTVSYPPLTYAQLIADDSTSAAPANSVLKILSSDSAAGRFSAMASPPSVTVFHYWGDAAFPFPNSGDDRLDANSYRAATLFFLAPGDRVLGALRLRAFQFITDINSVVPDPYRYYEVGLSHIKWSSSGSGMGTAWTAASFTEEYSYRFAEDKRFPQNLIFPPTDLQVADLASINTTTTVATALLPARNVFVRLAPAGELYDLKDSAGNTAASWGLNYNPGVSRRQVGLAPANLTAGTPPVLTAGVDEWHLILPDPGLGQAEERAALRQSGVALTAAQQTNDLAIRRQGKYGCALSVYP